MSQNRESSLKDKSILIIDDQKSFQKLLKGMLLQLGANNIVFYDSGEAALTQFGKETVDIVFIDYNLGQGRNGKQFLEELKYLNKLSRHCISILVTGESTRSIVLSVLEIEPDDYLIKPFSTGMLKSRLIKLSAKKQLFFHADKAINEGDLPLAIEQYLEIAKANPRFLHFCYKKLCQIYFELDRHQEAQSLLDEILANARPSWALTYLAQVLFLSGDYKKSICICDELLGQNRFNIDALDIKAMCLNKLQQSQESLFLIEQSCNIAPLSFSRQQKYADIALSNGAFDALAKAQYNLLAMSKGTVFSNIENQFNYIRAMFNQLQSANSEKAKVELSSSIKKALKNAAKDQSVIDKQGLFDEFSTFCCARLSANEGDYLNAKKLIAPFSIEPSISNTVLPDSVMALYALGEFDDANTQLEKYKASESSNQGIINQLEKHHQSLAGKQDKFEHYNAQGIALYKQGNYQDAIIQFENALEYAPMNTGSALNLLQALLQLLPKSNGASNTILAKCETYFERVEGMALPQQHAKRLDDLRFEYNKLAKLYQ